MGNAPNCSHIQTLGLWLVPLLEEVVEPLGDGALLEEMSLADINVRCGDQSSL